MDEYVSPNLGPQIDTVAEGTRVLVAQHRTLMIGTVIAAIILDLFIFWFWYYVLGNHRMLSVSNNDGSVFLLVVPFSIPMAVYAYYAGQARRMMLRQIAQSLGYAYEPQGSIKSIEGIIFSRGHARKIYDVLSGVHAGLPLRIFSYQYTVQEGKHSRTYHAVVCELTYPKHLPHILLKPRALLDGFEIELFGSGLEEISLEGNFHEHFDVSAEHGAQVQVREILEPEVMSRLMDIFSGSSIEIQGNKIYLMQSDALNDRAGYVQLHEHMGALIDDMLPGLRVAAADEAAEHAAAQADQSSLAT